MFIKYKRMLNMEVIYVRLSVICQSITYNQSPNSRTDFTKKKDACRGLSLKIFLNI
jgi:hypothetical protein